MTQDPPVQFLDLDSPEVDVPSGPVVVLLATEKAARDDWSARAAASLASAWAARGQRIFLADLGLMRPRLHEVLGVPNGEGVTDAFLYGASLQRVAKRTSGGFYFAPAGTPTVRAGEVLGGDRWEVFVQGFTRAGATLLLYLPADVPSAAAVVARASSLIVLGEDHDSAPGAGGASLVLRRADASLTDAGDPVDSPAPDPSGEGEVAGSTDGSTRAPDDTGPVSEAEAGPPVDRGTRVIERAPAAAAPVEEGAVRSRGWIPFVFILLAILAALVWLGVLPVPWLSSEGPAEARASAPLVGAPPQPAPPRHVLAVAAYRSAELAAQRAASLSARVRGLDVTVAPVSVNDEVYHRVVVGPTDASGVALRRELEGTLGSDGKGWVVRPGGFAVRLGSHGGEKAAKEAAESFRADGVFAYVRLERTGDGEPVFSVWAGAFADPDEASVMLDALREAGIEARVEALAGVRAE